MEIYITVINEKEVMSLKKNKEEQSGRLWGHERGWEMI